MKNLKDEFTSKGELVWDKVGVAFCAGSAVHCGPQSTRLKRNSVELICCGHS